MDYRPATAADTAAIAALHAESWRLHYRGSFPDAFLDGDVGTERLAEWTERLARPAPEDRTTVAVDGEGEIVGLAHTILHDDPEWGALLDNLHVRPDLKRQVILRYLDPSCVEQAANLTLVGAPGLGNPISADYPCRRDGGGDRHRRDR